MGMSYEKYIDISNGIDGWLTADEQEALIMGATLALPSAAPMFCELGAFKGRSSVLIGGVMALLNKGGLLFSVDPHEGGLTYPRSIKNGGLTGSIEYSQNPTLKDFQDNIKKAGLEDYVYIVVGKSTEFYPPFSLDFLFIDALHDEDSVRADWNHYRPRIKIKSIVAWHDYGVWQGVTDTVNDLLHRGIIEKEFQGDSLIVTKYRGAI